MRLPPIGLAAFPLPLVASAAGCSSVPRADAEPARAIEIDPRTGELIKDFSDEILNHGGDHAPPSVVIARVDEWFDLAFAYDTAKAELERCVDPKLEATLLAGAEVWPSGPPLSATKKFDKRDFMSFPDERSALSSIELETLNTPDGAELRLNVR